MFFVAHILHAVYSGNDQYQPILPFLPSRFSLAFVTCCHFDHPQELTFSRDLMAWTTCSYCSRRSALRALSTAGRTSWQLRRIATSTPFSNKCMRKDVYQACRMQELIRRVCQTV